MLLVIVVVDHVPDYHGGHEAHGVTQCIDDPHQGPSEVICNILEYVFRTEYFSIFLAI